MFGGAAHINVTRLPIYLSQCPAGTSVRTMMHWTQQVRSKKFRMYDYGSAEKNMARYNRTTPPVYKLSDVTVKTALFSGGRDVFSDAADVQLLVDSMPTAAVEHWREIPD